MLFAPGAFITMMPRCDACDNPKRGRGGNHVLRDLRRAAHNQRIRVGECHQEVGQRPSGLGIEYPRGIFTKERNGGGRKIVGDNYFHRDCLMEEGRGRMRKPFKYNLSV
jgi:hypothetical protein